LVSHWEEIAAQILHGGYADAQGMSSASLTWKWAKRKHMYANYPPKVSVFQGSATQTVDGDLKVWAPSFWSSTSPLLGATLRAQHNQNVAVSLYGLKNTDASKCVSFWMTQSLGLLWSPQWGKRKKMLMYSRWIFLRVCAACPTPRLNLRFQLCPSWNIHHTVTDDPVSKPDRRYARRRDRQIYMSEE